MDLYACVVYTLVMSAALLVLNIGNLVALLLVLFVPGYVFVAALFPRNTDIDWIERIALSIGLSIAVVPLLGLLLNFTPWGIRFAPIVATILIFTLGVGWAAYRRRMQAPSEKRLAATITLGLLEREESATMDKSLTIVLAVSVVIAAGTLVYVVTTPRPEEHFTEFYILGPGGNASGYPTALNVSQNGSVIIGIANHEAAETNYTVRVDLVGVRIVYNATVAFNETVEVNLTTWTWFNATISDGANWTNPYTFSIPTSGLWKVRFLLFKDGDFSSAYRELHLYVRVQ